MSAFNEFMVNSMVHDPFNDGLMFGVQGKIKEIPKGFVHQTILHFGTGIKQASILYKDKFNAYRENINFYV